MRALSLVPVRSRSLPQLGCSLWWPGADRIAKRIRTAKLPFHLLTPTILFGCGLEMILRFLAGL